MHEQAGDNAQALALLRRAQQLHERRAQLSSRARYQAASLQTELLQMQHKLAENDAQRRATEKSHAELASINRELSARIEQVQSLERALREQATRDELTGLFNRRHLNEILPALWAASQRERMPLAAVIIDLDHFKSVNDHHGHLAGDLLLARFGKLLAADTRKSDIVCRYGGEEFCLLMPRTDAADRAPQGAGAARTLAGRGVQVRRHHAARAELFRRRGRHQTRAGVGDATVARGRRRVAERKAAGAGQGADGGVGVGLTVIATVLPCHSERSEESPPVRTPEIPRSARDDRTSILPARMTECSVKD